MNLSVVKLLFFAVLLFVLSSTSVFADSTATSSASTIPSQEDQTTSANETIDSIKNFIVSLDSLAGGFVFSTPSDLFSDTVHLSGGAAINNLSVFRNMFIAISIPMTAIIIFYIGGANMIGGNLSYLKPFILRLVFYVVLVLLFAPLLTLTINTENALTSSILNAPVLSQKETSLTQFAIDFWNKAEAQIASGQSTPESVGIPNIGWSSFFQSLVHAVIEISLFLIGIAALVLGIIFILTQFALRFLGLLFLSLVFPLALPFIISQKTEGIFYSFLRIWFTFLIHQPAFAIGYMMIMMIARSILNTQGASFSLMFLYIASLFFLGTINVLASRIFADGLTAVGANLEAGIAAGGLISGFQTATGTSTGVSQSIYKGAGKLYHTLTKRVPVSTEKPDPKKSGNPAIGHSTIPDDQQTNSKYVTEFNNKGFVVDKVQKQNGIYALSGKGYSYYDAKNNVTHTFPTKKDALDSGYKENQLRETSMSKRQVVDLSQFKNGNPHNAYATKQALSAGHTSDWAHITKRSDAIRVKHNLEMNQDNFKKLGVNGYLVKHYDNPNGEKSSKRATTRIITLGKEDDK